MTLLGETPAVVFPSRDEATAARPPEAGGGARDEVRMLVARPQEITGATFRDLADHVRSGDLVVVNDSATVPGQLDAELVGRGPVVLHVATRLPDGTRVVELRSSPAAQRAVLDATTGDRITAGPASLRLVAPYPASSSPTGQGNRLWRAAVSGPLEEVLVAHGRPIAYGYLDRPYPLDAYQSVFATRPGSAEMPSAGRPFTPELVTRLVARGVGVAPVTLHTGVSSQEAGEAPQPEWFSVPGSTARLVNATRAGGGRVIAVGTTVTRALESAVEGHLVAEHSGWTDRLVTPMNPPRVVSGLITGWHDPGASHLLLVEAVAGSVLAQRAYDAAVAGGYRWHEFGDSALFLP